MTSTPTPTKIQFNSQAYHKAIFHAAKYPQSSVNGIFTGFLSQNSSDQHILHIVDAFPLFHSQITLTPLLEASLLQIESLLKHQQQQQQQKSEQKMMICGYYFANEHLSDETMSAFHQSVANKIYHQTSSTSSSSPSSSVVFMV